MRCTNRPSAVQKQIGWWASMQRDCFRCCITKPLTVGRVQTPTLKMLVDRDAKILRFQKEKYYTVGIHSGSLKADSGCIADAETANSLKEKCTSAVAVCTSVKREKKTEQPPKLYDLTTLQRRQTACSVSRQSRPLIMPSNFTKRNC